MRRSQRAVQITDAPPSPTQERHHREIRYLSMMLIRMICLILATVLVTVHAPLLALWVPILILGAVLLPWFAVILANDGAPRRSRRTAMRAPDDQAQRVLTRGDQDAVAHPVIDVDP